MEDRNKLVLESLNSRFACKTICSDPRDCKIADLSLVLAV